MKEGFKVSPRIFVLDSLRIGGAQKVTLDLASFLAKEGYNVHIIIYRDNIDFDIPNNIILHKLYIPGLSKRNIFDYPERIISLMLSKLWSFIFSFFSSWILSKKIREISSKSKVYLIADSSFSYFFRIKNTFDTTIILHSQKSIQYKKHPLDRLFAKKIFSRILKNVNTYAISKAIFNDIVQNFEVSIKNLKLVYNYVDSQKIQKLANSKCELIPNEPYFIFIGRLSFEKRVFDLIEKFADFKLKTASEYKLIIVGDGPDNLELKKKCFFKKYAK